MNNLTIFVIDDREEEIRKLFQNISVKELVLVPPQKFSDFLDQILTDKRAVVLIGYGLGLPDTTGSDIVKTLRANGFTNSIIGNSGGGKIGFEHDGVAPLIDAWANRDANLLNSILPLESLKVSIKLIFPEALYLPLMQKNAFAIKGKLPELAHQLYNPNAYNPHFETCGTRPSTLTPDQIEHLDTASNEVECENAVKKALETGNKATIQKSLEQFLEIQKTCVARDGQHGHGYWVHSLSHFVDKLWDRLDTQVPADLLKSLYCLAISGAAKGDTNCCDRLIRSFFNKAPRQVGAAEYGLVWENLEWYAKPFCSQENFRDWLEQCREPGIENQGTFQLQKSPDIDPPGLV